MTPFVFEPTLQAAHERIKAVRPQEYARTRNALDGAVTRLSPYLTHGFVSLPEVHAGVAASHLLATSTSLSSSWAGAPISSMCGATSAQASTSRCTTV